MLNVMRKHARHWLMILLLGIIIIVFVFYFGTMREGGDANGIASLDGKLISYADFQREYEKLIDMYRANLGGNLTEELLKGLKVKEQAVDNLLKQAIVLEQASVLGVQASDEEIKNTISTYPAFQRNGFFDHKVYEQALRQNRMTPENFEALQRNILIMKKLQDLLASGVHVSDSEVLDLYRFQNEKVNIRFLKLTSRDYRDEVKPTPQLLEKYFKEHEKELRVPEQIQVKYLAFLAADFASSVKVTDDEVRDFYERNKERLVKKEGKPPSLEALRGDITAYLRQSRGMQKAAEEAKKAHDSIYQQENFDAYAAEKGLKTQTSALFPANNVPAEFRELNDFAKNIFPLQPKEISKVLSDGRGHYLFQVLTRKPSYTPDFKEAAKDIEARYVASEAKLLCQKEADKMLARVKKGEDLESIAREKKLKIQETGLFVPGTNVPELGAAQELPDFVAQLSETRPYPEKVLPIGDNFYVLRFKERGKIEEQDFQAKKADLQKAFTELKKNEVINAWIEGLKNSLLKEGRLKIMKDIKDV